MKKVYDKCCGVDVHKKIIAACFLNGKEKELRKHRTMYKREEK